MFSIFKPYIFSLDPEVAHHLAIKSLKFNILPKSIFSVEQEELLETKLFNEKLSNPIGLAAGFDKSAEVYNSLFQLGYGFVEVGTLTLKPQAGNPKPRIHRFSKEKNIVNSLGFNNVGVYEGLKNIEKNKPFFNGILGVSIGKSKETKIENAFKDYLHLIDYVYDQADYIAINISSPNTENLRELSSENYFKDLIEKIMNKKEQLNGGNTKDVPFVLKISPDESMKNLEKIFISCMDFKVDGLILNNSSIKHKKNLNGGISGNYIREISEKNLMFAKDFCGYAKDVAKRIDVGAELIQLYSGIIFSGTDLLKDSLEI